MALSFEISAKQIRGDRASQEDAFLTTNLGDETSGRATSSLVTIADGMGGHAGGEIASNLVVSTFNKSFAHQFDNKNIPKILGDCLDEANSALAQNIREAPELSGMGCTMVSALLSDGKLWWNSVGDSHLYLIRDRRLSKLNDDHSYGAFLDQMKAHGMDMGLSPGLSRNMLVSAITGDEITAIDCPVKPRELKSGDRIIIASDGLDTLAREAIARISASASDPSTCVQALLQAVEEAGKSHQDNTTVIAIDVFGQGAQAATPCEDRAATCAVVSSTGKSKSDSAGPGHVDSTGSEIPLREGSAGEKVARPPAARTKEQGPAQTKSAGEPPAPLPPEDERKPGPEPEQTPSGVEKLTKSPVESPVKAATPSQKKPRDSKTTSTQEKSKASVAPLAEKRAKHARGPKPVPKTESRESASKPVPEHPAPPILKPLSTSQPTKELSPAAKSESAPVESKKKQDISTDFDPESTLPLEFEEEPAESSTLPDTSSAKQTSAPSEIETIADGDDIAETLAFSLDTQSEDAPDSAVTSAAAEPQESVEALSFDDVFDTLDDARSDKTTGAKILDPISDEETPSKRSGKGVLFGIAATVLVGVGVGAFLLKNDGVAEFVEEVKGTVETIASLPEPPQLPEGTDAETPLGAEPEPIPPPQTQQPVAQVPDSASEALAETQGETEGMTVSVEPGPSAGGASPSEPETVAIDVDSGIQETTEPDEVAESAAEPVSESEVAFQTEEEPPTPIQTDDPPQPDMPSIADAESTVALTEPEDSVLEPEPPDTEQAEAISFTPSTFRDALKDGGTGPQMALIPGGTFRMGSGGMTASADEYPPHDVTVQPFAISQHEITVAEYAKFAKATRRRLPRGVSKGKGTHPIVSVSWNDAIRYTQWLTKETGKRYRLPSETEWEYAASAGATTPHWWGYEVTDGQAHCFGCGDSVESRGPMQVGSFPPNPFGLHDTAGNVMEWVEDCYHRNYQGAPDDGRSWEGGDCSYRMVRGGAYNSPPPSIRTAKRAKRKSGRGYDTVGIRVVREP